MDLADRAGWRPIEDWRDFTFAKDIGERLQRAADAAGFEEIGQLHEFLTSLGEWVEPALTTVATEAGKREYVPFAVPEDVLAVLLLCWGRVNDDVIQAIYFDPIAQGVIAAIAQLPEEI